MGLMTYADGRTGLTTTAFRYKLTTIAGGLVKDWTTGATWDSPSTGNYTLEDADAVPGTVYYVEPIEGVHTEPGRIPLDPLDATATAEAAAAALTAHGASTFDPTTDEVAHVTLVDTTTVNTDMRGTDSAATAAELAAHDAKLEGVAVNAASAAGADFGEDECTLTITDTTSAALSDAQVYVYVGAARSRVKTTDSLGQVKFDLTDGETYNLWVTHDRYTGTNPTSFVASKDV
jgi:hypothetical protein